MSNEPRALTDHELRHRFLDQCRAYSRYWATVEGPTTVQERLDGLLFSVLVAIDGGSALPFGLDLVARVHPDDKAHCQAEGEDWVEAGTVLNADHMLHELLRTSAAPPVAPHREG